MPHPTPQTWTVIVPVKQLAVAKTRLTRFAGGLRQDLALAFATDTVVAAIGSSLVRTVLVVTDDPRVVAAVTAQGAEVVADDPGSGLNPALRHGAQVAAQRRPAQPVVAVSADLPALRPGELDHVLRCAAAHPVVFVPDTEGTGTTVLAATDVAAFRPSFGHRSRAAHRADGVVELREGPLESVRRDVDTEVDLYDALRLGVGPRTQRVLAAIGGLSEADTVGSVQATVRSFDPRTRSGTVLLDDGTELPYGAAAFDVGGLRLARVGQRVRIRVDPAGAQVTFLTLATLPDPGSDA